MATVFILFYILGWIQIHISFVIFLNWRLINTDTCKMIFLLIVLCTARSKMIRCLSFLLLVCTVCKFRWSHVFRLYLPVNIWSHHLFFIFTNVPRVLNFIIYFWFVYKFSFLSLFCLFLLNISNKSLLIFVFWWLNILSCNSTFCL